MSNKENMRLELLAIQLTLTTLKSASSYIAHQQDLNERLEMFELNKQGFAIIEDFLNKLSEAVNSFQDFNIN